MLIGIGLILIAAIGLYLVQTKQNKPVINTNTNTNKPPVVDTSDWKTYSQPALGIEFKYPASWYISNEHLGKDIGNEDPYWRDIEGKIFIMGPNINFELIVKKSNEPLSEVKKGVSIFLANEGTETVVSGWPAIVYERPLKYSSTVGENVSWQARKKLLIDSNNTYYYLNSSEAASEKTSTEDAIMKREALLTSLKINQ